MEIGFFFSHKVILKVIFAVAGILLGTRIVSGRPTWLSRWKCCLKSISIYERRSAYALVQVPYLPIIAQTKAYQTPLSPWHCINRILIIVLCSWKSGAICIICHQHIVLKTIWFSVTDSLVILYFIKRAQFIGWNIMYW